MFDYKTYIADGSDEGARGISHVQVSSSSSARAIHFGGYRSTENSIYYHQLGLISYRDLGPKKSMA